MLDGKPRASNVSRLVTLLAIQGIERFFWMYWFLGVQERTTIGIGVLLCVTYALPMLLAPLVGWIGSGRALLGGSLLYAFGFLTATTTPMLGVWLIVTASGVHKTAFAPTMSELGDNRAYPLLYFSVNIASGASAFAYGWLHRHVGTSGMDAVACASFLIAAIFTRSLLDIAGVRKNEAGAGHGSYPKLLALAMCQLPFFVCSWKFQTDYRISLTPVFAAAGLPEGSLIGTTCVAVTIFSFGLGTKRFAGLLKDARGVLSLGTVITAGYFVLAGYTAKHTPQLYSALPFVILAESLVYSVAESLVGAVSQRLMVEAAPTKALGSAAYFCMVGAGALLAYLMGSPLKPLLFVLAGIALLTPALLIMIKLSDQRIP